jgi:hypothetical protein
MGMFDYILYDGKTYQSKDTPGQSLMNYKIDSDGNLWVEEFDSEWCDDESSMFGGWLKRINLRWERVKDFDGQLVFYRNVDDKYKQWETHTVSFVGGVMTSSKTEIEEDTNELDY